MTRSTLRKKITTVLGDDSFLAFIYKLSHDTLFLLVLFFFFYLITERIDPGITAGHISSFWLTFLLIANLATLGLSTKNVNIHRFAHKKKISLLNYFLGIISFLLISTSMLRYPILLNFTITIASMFIFILFYKELFSQEK